MNNIIWPNLSLGMEEIGHCDLVSDSVTLSVMVHVSANCDSSDHDNNTDNRWQTFYTLNNDSVSNIYANWLLPLFTLKATGCCSKPSSPKTNLDPSSVNSRKCCTWDPINLNARYPLSHLRIMTPSTTCKPRPHITGLHCTYYFKKISVT